MHGRTPQLGLPWQGRSPVAAQSSYEAAREAEATLAGKLKVLRNFYRRQGRHGATDAEVSQQLGAGWPPNVVTARRNDLVDAGQVVVRYPDSRRQSVLTTSNRRVTVWILSEYGR